MFQGNVGTIYDAIFSYPLQLRVFAPRTIQYSYERWVPVGTKT